MQKILLFVDKASTFAGHFFSWSIVGLTLLISWEVFSRYALNTPHAWALDAQIMLYGVLFMMAGAYTLAAGGHVRGDVLYGFFEPRTQAAIDLVLYVLFFLPGIFAMAYAGWTYASDSLAIHETTFSPSRCRSIRSNSSSRWRRSSCSCRGSSRSSVVRSACATASGRRAWPTWWRWMSPSSWSRCTYGKRTSPSWMNM